MRGKKQPQISKLITDVDDRTIRRKNFPELPRSPYSYRSSPLPLFIKHSYTPLDFIWTYLNGQMFGLLFKPSASSQSRFPHFTYISHASLYSPGADLLKTNWIIQIFPTKTSLLNHLLKQLYKVLICIQLVCL